MAPGRLEACVGQLLRAGVLAAAAVILSGLVLLWARGDAGLALSRDPVAEFARGPGAAAGFPRTPGAVLTALAGGHPGAVMQLGLLMLMLLPLVRVAATVALFLAGREHAHAAIAACVLALLAFAALD